jgi:hypothetical protein
MYHRAVRRVIAIAAVATCGVGCDALFNLDHVRPGPAIGAQPDAPAMLPDAACAGAPTTLLLGARTGGTGQASMADTFLISDVQATKNYGAATTLVLCNTCDAEGLPWNDIIAVALLRFDTGAVCPGSKILTATLQLQTTDDNLGNGSVGVFAVREPWTEGSNAGSIGAASWSQRMPDTSWSNAGAGSPGSSDPTMLVEFAPTNRERTYPIALPVDLVQGWVDKPATNFGLLLAITVGNSDVQFHSRESTTAAARPGLEVTVDLP